MEPNQIPSPETQQSPAASGTSFGPIIGIGVIILALVVGALYFWGGAIAKDEAELAPVSSSDEVEDIEADLESQSSAEIDFSDIEGELSE
jgi:hypothetical protein